MAQEWNVDRIWWRNVPLGEFYNVERHPSVTKGGQGSLYFEIPKRLVPATLDFLGLPDLGSLPFTIQAGIAGEEGIAGAIEFQRKASGPNENNRMRITRQNRQMTGAERHPAWTAERGFPTAPSDVRRREEAAPHFPVGGLRIYIARTIEGDYYAGFTTGLRPTGMASNDPAWDLYTQGRTVGGVIDAG